jgi:hypothetical protein
VRNEQITCAGLLLRADLRRVLPHLSA